jgi:single-strand DNA-binding protein
MNSVNLIGRITKDPEVRKDNDGKTVCTLTLAVDDTFSREDRADFIRIMVFGKQGENCEKYLRKGFLAGISGRLHSNSYTDSEGVRRYPVEVISDRVQFLQFPDRSEK